MLRHNFGNLVINLRRAISLVLTGVANVSTNSKGRNLKMEKKSFTDVNLN